MAAVLAGLALPAGARADGDPASDYLVTNRVFLAYGASSRSRPEQQLQRAVTAANRAGFAIRVAVISSPYDLGSITELWRRPRLYARFLGQELSLAYQGRLLVVMPDGFGFHWPGHSAGSAYRLLRGVPVPAAGAGPAEAAQTAVRRLAGAAGIALPPPPAARTGTGGPPGAADSGLPLLAVAAAGLALAAALLLIARARRPRLRGVVLGLALIGAAAVVTPILALRALRNAPGATGASGSSVLTPPPFSWPSGRRPAPQFVLRDQYGRPVSLAAERGRPVIVTFIDPLCRNLCPLEAKVLNDVVGRMPASKRPDILAVSVDVYDNANARANLGQDDRRWQLVPQWHWAVGSPGELAAVWKRYMIGVKVTTRRIARTAIRYITHTEGAYIIDATGHERALFLWPFYPQDVERVLARVT